MREPALLFSTDRVPTDNIKPLRQPSHFPADLPFCGSKVKNNCLTAMPIWKTGNQRQDRIDRRSQNDQIASRKDLLGAVRNPVSPAGFLDQLSCGWVWINHTQAFYLSVKRPG